MKCDADTFAAKYQEIYLDLYRFARYTLKHTQDAEDIVSETVLDAWKSIHRLKKEEAFRPWMFRILARKCQKHLKHSNHSTLELPESLTEYTPDLSEAMDVRAAFCRLDDEERLILSLKLFAGYSSKEIAVMLNRNENTIRSRQSRALKKMEQQLNDKR